MTHAIEFRNVSKVYPGGRPAVDGLSFALPSGKTLALVGPSGCGKTTTLKMINRLTERTSGDILLNGRSISDVPVYDLRRSLGYVIQYVGLFPHMSVAENVAVVPRLLSWPAAKIDRRVDELLELVGLPPAEYRTRRPRQLSGGQQQRVGVARALAADPPVLLMDEPFGALDPITRLRLQDELVSIQKKLHKTVVIVTHDMDEAIRLADVVAVMKEGKLVQLGSPAEILARPVEAFVADLLGHDRLLKLLRTTPVMAVPLGPAGAGGPRIARDLSLEQALLVMLEASVDRVDVLDGDRVLGSLDASTLVSSVMRTAAADRQVA
ncbi:MAG: ATP-binding cassette domain-containing protein [Hyphomicrobiales bacterium]